MISSRCRRLAALVVLVTAASLAAASAQAAAPPPASDAASAPSVTKGRGLLVAYHRSGGFAGFDDELSVSRSGLAFHRARNGVVRVFWLSPAELTELADALAAADFPSLKPKYLPKFPVSDGFTYTLTHVGKTVVTADGAVPPALAAPIAVLDRLLAPEPCRADDHTGGARPLAARPGVVRARPAPLGPVASACDGTSSGSDDEARGCMRDRARMSSERRGTSAVVEATAIPRRLWLYAL